MGYWVDHLQEFDDGRFFEDYLLPGNLSHGRGQYLHQDHTRYHRLFREMAGKNRVRRVEADIRTELAGGGMDVIEGEDV
jgi:hypothetical protein